MIIQVQVQMSFSLLLNRIMFYKLMFNTTLFSNKTDVACMVFEFNLRPLYRKGGRRELRMEKIAVAFEIAIVVN